MVERFEKEIGGRSLLLEMGKLAGQASGAVTVRYGDTVVLVTACAAHGSREGIDFLPLTVDYEERLYAAGKIPGSFFRREGRPGQEAILSARLIDRLLRPLFPKGLYNEIQVVVTVLSVDLENSPDVLGALGASIALGVSDIPFQGPAAATRVGYIDGQFVINPTYSQLSRSQLDLVVAGTRDSVVMIEAGAQEVSEKTILEAVRTGHLVNQELVELQEELIRAFGRPKWESPSKALPAELEDQVGAVVNGRISDAVYSAGEKQDRDKAIEALRQGVLEALKERFPEQELNKAFESALKVEVRKAILERSIRPDGRGLKDIRPISGEAGILPRTHGSALFTRGQTQVMTIATLASMGMVQTLDTISQEDSKRFIHHYNFPPFSTGEVKRLGSPGRREVGHGALVERALLPVIPSEEAFPYTIRLVSEVVSSNGSTSMASTCASTLSLMDAGVPIKAPVAGIAMGLITEGQKGRHAILTDIQGMEDALGDMDFKVAGTAQGVTALQMDIKTSGIGYEILDVALEQAREARLFILQKMLEVLPQPRSALSPHAPRMIRITIPQDKIGSVIGPGGKTIRSIIEQTKATVDIEDDGTVIIGSTSNEAAQKALEIIKSMTREVVVGEVYTGKVTRIVGFGAFVEIFPGKEGLVHISELADYRVAKVEDVVKVGDEITVKVREIDAMGRLNLSHRAVLQAEATSAGGVEGRGDPRTDGGARPFRGGSPGGRPSSPGDQGRGNGPGRPPYRRGPYRS